MTVFNIQVDIKKRETVINILYSNDISVFKSSVKQTINVVFYRESISFLSFLQDLIDTKF